MNTQKLMLAPIRAIVKIQHKSLQLNTSILKFYQIIINNNYGIIIIIIIITGFYIF